MTRKDGFNKCLHVGLAGFCVISFTSKALAQHSNIIPDNSLGAESSQVIENFQGLSLEVITGGTQRGINLFHSFREFNVSEGRGAYFFSPNTEIQNILARVTGNNRSDILGRLGTSGSSNPNLFLINPNGIVFGENASLDVQGSFVGTTADSVDFGEQGIFSAKNPEAPLLKISVPIGLQFGKQPGIITTTNNQFGSLSGGTVALIGGEINVDGGLLFSQNGQVKLAAVGEDSTVGLNVNGSSLGFQFSEGVRRESINITNGEIFAVDENSEIELFGGDIDINNSVIFGSDGGSINIDGTKLNLNQDSQIFSLTSGTIKGGDIQIQVKNEVSLANNSIITSLSNASATAAGGDVTINAGKITISGDETLENSSEIGASTLGAGNGGNLTLNATESVNIINGRGVLVLAGGAGKAGNLTVRATDAVNVTNKGLLALLTSGSGSTGNMRIETGTLRVQNTYLQGGIGAGTIGGGNVGSIAIQARNGVEVINGSISTSVLHRSTTQATAGDITIETQRVNVKEGGSISTDTLSSANGANISIQASEYVEISGVSLSSGNSQISSNAFGATGNGGNVMIETPRLTLSQGGDINTGSLRSSGNPGNITIRAKDVEIDGFVFLPKEQLSFFDDLFDEPLVQEGISRRGGINFTSTLSSNVTESDNADVRGGMITIDTERLRLSNGGNIETSVSLERGKGGNIVVRASDSIDITGVGPQRLDGSFAPSGLFAELQTGGIGSGGSIDVTTGRLNLNNQGQISAGTVSQGDAGNIGITANQIDLRGSSRILTQVDDEATGNAGNLSIKTQLLNVQEESQISSGSLGNGNGGDLKVEADTIILKGSDSEFPAGLLSSIGSTGKGKGSDMDITTNRLFVRDGAVIFSGSRGNGEAGDINIIANFLEINGTGGRIASFTDAGNGGDINLDIGNLLLLRRGGFISTTAGRNQAGGDGGNIDINSKFIVVPASENSDISANAFTGRGGNVNITAQAIFGVESRPQPTDESDITASSQLGIDGETNINTADTSSIQNSFTGLSPTIDTDALIANSCIVRGNQRQQNSFRIIGSGALPPNRPGEGLVSNYTTGEVRGVETASRPWKKGDPIIEPQGLYRLSDGRLLLSRECSG